MRKHEDKAMDMALIKRMLAQHEAQEGEGHEEAEGEYANEAKSHDMAIKARMKALDSPNTYNSNPDGRPASVNLSSADEQLDTDVNYQNKPVNDSEHSAGVNRPKAGPASQSDDKEKMASIKQIVGDTLLDKEDVARRTNPLSLKDRVKANVRSINKKSK